MTFTQRRAAETVLAVPRCATYDLSAPPFASSLRAAAVDRAEQSHGGWGRAWDGGEGEMFRSHVCAEQEAATTLEEQQDTVHSGAPASARHVRDGGGNGIGDGGGGGGVIGGRRGGGARGSWPGCVTSDVEGEGNETSVAAEKRVAAASLQRRPNTAACSPVVVRMESLPETIRPHSSGNAGLPSQKRQRFVFGSHLPDLPNLPQTLQDPQIWRWENNTAKMSTTAPIPVLVDR
jgi:hypothetical protein